MFDGLERLSVEACVEVYGDGGLAEPARQRAAELAQTDYYGHRWAVAVAPDAPERAIGSALVTLPLHDNRTVADITVTVAAGFRRRGIGTALLDWAEAAAQAAGRTTIQSWVEAGRWPEGAPVVHGPEGGDFPAASPGWALAQARGYALAEIEYISLLDLPADPARLAPLQRDADSVTSDYRLHCWAADVPAEWRAAYATLMRRFTEDVPSGGLDYEPEPWDEARLASQLRRAAETGMVYQFAAAEHVATGELAALTTLLWIDQPGRPAIQETTVVLRAHRGHRLGLWVKLGNLRELARRRPDAPYVHTQNAAENGPMRRINDKLGFRRAGAVAAVQKA
jgi:GNAT superfamily N-acetyltransferase